MRRFDQIKANVAYLEKKGEDLLDLTRASTGNLVSEVKRLVGQAAQSKKVFQLETNLALVQKRETKEIVRRKELAAKLVTVKKELVAQETLSTLVALCVSGVQDLMAMRAKHLAETFAFETFLKDRQASMAPLDMLCTIKDYAHRMDGTVQQFKTMMQTVSELDKLTLSS